MTENEHARASIRATVDEIVAGHDALALPADEDEFLEAWEIIDRIERSLQAAKAEAWAKRWERA